MKLLNIVTKNIEVFSRVEEYLYNTYGIMLRITNNKKALLKSNIVINIDFNNEEINKFSMPKDIIVLNVNTKENLKVKTINTKVIDGYKIELQNKHTKEFKEYNIYHNFNKNLLYEGTIYKKDSYKNIRQIIKRDNIKIMRLNNFSKIT